MPKEFTTSSGARVKINMAPFQDGMALKNAIMAEVAKSGVSIDMKDINLNAEVNVDKLIKLVAAVDCSPAVNQCLMVCLGRSTYNNERITAATFEDEKAREDYYEVIIEGLKFNLAPFFKSLFARLQTLRPTTQAADTQG
jgi:hypothetical protein